MWISSIVPVRKKNGQIRVCVDFRNLNNACPKDDFPLPIAELMIDATTGHEALSFMDGSSGYNQIRMAPADEELTVFRTPKGIYCYNVMPFGLKNTGATYQRAMQRILDDMLHKNVECYVDDLVVKSKKRADHFYDLRKVFERLRRYQLKMSPSKCAFGVTSRKFLGFIVRQRGIEIEQANIDAILRMSEPRNIHELKSLQGKLAYLRRFISNQAGRCQPFSRLMKKEVPFEWDEACDKAFKSIKLYLMKPLVLVAPVHGRLLILYVAAQERSVGILLAQKNDEGKENALYYLSRTMTPNELKCSPIEKLCLAFIFAIQKLKHYFQSHSIDLVSKANPLKYIMTKLILSDRLARWYLQLQQFEITYVPQKAIKGQVLANFLADHPMPAEWELSDDLPDEDVLVIEITPPWKMYFDGASHKEGAGAGVVFVTSEGEERQQQADALAKLASILSMTDKEARIPICKSWIIPSIFSDDEDDTFQEEENHVMEVFEIEEEDWRQPLVDYLEYGKKPSDP
ncbi:UNVERIFIED_CONTAM: Transposon Tf2-12 polyprotein [Sesamum latifolium]|uniref:Transposon Tf2-12 polyprotein n=1 Tax=Sesamum latifolium TaxID=2727402 RepID=A0AAW2U439_9LAMI